MTDNETEHLTYIQAYGYADTLFAQLFEGLPQAVDWTPEEIAMINTTQIYALVDPFTHKARKRWISKILLWPMGKYNNL